MMTTMTKKTRGFGSKIILIKPASNISLSIRGLTLLLWGCRLALMTLKQITTLGRRQRRLWARNRGTPALTRIMTTRTSMKMWECQRFL
jgi:hypothetical protein